MSTIKTVKFLNESINIESYIEVKHYGNIVCEECDKAPMHIVKKEKSKPYFASNRKSEHDANCQHYTKDISDNQITNLLKSDNDEDKVLSLFLIESNLSAAIKLLIKNNDLLSEQQQKEAIADENNIFSSKNLGNHTPKSILRTHIQRMRTNEELINRHIIIYGRADLTVKTLENSTKHLLFKIDNELFFSIFLSVAQTGYFKMQDGIYPIGFAVFGELTRNVNPNRDFLNLRILTTENLKILQEE